MPSIFEAPALLMLGKVELFSMELLTGAYIDRSKGVFLERKTGMV
jgi:hypothetical protein